VLNDGHDLDWFCKHPEDPEKRFQEALALFSMIGHVPLGMSIRGSWPAEVMSFDCIEELRFLCAAPGPCPPGLKLLPMEMRGLREGVRAGLSARAWCDSVKGQLREFASRNKSIIVPIRPQVLAKHDPKLALVKEVLDLIPLVGMQIQTCRDLLKQ